MATIVEWFEIDLTIIIVTLIILLETLTHIDSGNNEIKYLMKIGMFPSTRRDVFLTDRLVVRILTSIPTTENTRITLI